MRAVVIVIGFLVALIGLSQVVAAPWWLRVLPTMAATRDAIILGVFAFVVGAILVIAALQRAVALRTFVLVLGLLMLIGGLALALNPVAMRSIMYAIVLSRPEGAQIGIVVAGGVIRTVLGLLLIYAAAIRREPRLSTRGPITA